MSMPSHTHNSLCCGAHGPCFAGLVDLGCHFTHVLPHLVYMPNLKLVSQKGLVFALFLLAVVTCLPVCVCVYCGVYVCMCVCVCVHACVCVSCNCTHRVGVCTTSAKQVMHARSKRARLPSMSRLLVWNINGSMLTGTCLNPSQCNIHKLKARLRTLAGPRACKANYKEGQDPIMHACILVC